jgi:hypothetical protein
LVSAWRIILALGLATGGCVSSREFVNDSGLRLYPEQAVMNAAAVAPRGVTAIFEMPVRAVGRSTGKLHLNSERDYRDQRNLSILVSPVVERALSERLGEPLENRLVGATIAVRGTAYRVRIDFFEDGRPTGKYYYQTHVRLETADDLTVTGERPRA